MAELLQPQKMINMYCGGLAYTVDIVSREVDKHDVLCAVLLRRQELSP